MRKIKFFDWIFKMSFCLLSVQFPKPQIWDVGTRCRSGLIGFSAKRKRTALTPTHHTHLFRRLNMRNHIGLQIQNNQQLAKFTHYDIAQSDWSLNIDEVLLWWKQVNLCSNMASMCLWWLEQQLGPWAKRCFWDWSFGDNSARNKRWAATIRVIVSFQWG